MGGKKKPRGEMTEAELEEERRKDRRRRKLRDLGKPSMVPAGPASQHVRRLHDVSLMSYREIAELAGVAETTVGDLYRGYRNASHANKRIELIPRTTQDKILAVPAREADPSSHVLVSPIGTIRRMQALARQGFGAYWIAFEIFGYTDQNSVWRLMTQRPVGRHRQLGVTVATSETMKRAYSKYCYVDPLHVGITAQAKSKTVNWAIKNGWAGPDAWDDQTIDDPDAIAEWTGVCGTEEGYRVHIRETLAGNHLPLCEPCKAAVEMIHKGEGEPPFVFLREAFDQALKDRGINVRQLAIKIYRDVKAADKLYRWRSGDRQPQNRAQVAELASALGVEMGSLIRDVEVELTPAQIERGRFNRFAFRAVIEAVGLSQRAAGRECGVGETSIAKWIKGAYAPQSKEILKPLAKKLNISVEVFYS